MQYSSDDTYLNFWGVRGSCASPITGAEIDPKLIAAISSSRKKPEMCPREIVKSLEFWQRSTYGGNTSCVEVIMDGQRIVLDMGTGLRVLGNSLMYEMFQNKGLNITFLVSHVHWDHIQGVPFFGPLYINKHLGINNTWGFYGGTDWQKPVESCLRGQMDPPAFPVSWELIEKMTHHMNSTQVYDRMTMEVGSGNKIVRIKTRQLDHPQETYGWRLESSRGFTVVYTTDNEPRESNYTDPKLLELAKGADIWITDCQYTHNQYRGYKIEGGVNRYGWGHSYPEAVAHTAVEGGVKNVVLFHHDPNSSDEKIYLIGEHTQELVSSLGGNSKVFAAYEGMRFINNTLLEF